jgi:hypothetical protein
MRSSDIPPIEVGVRSGEAPMRTEKTLPTWLNALLVVGTFLGLLWLERRRPLHRRQVEPKLRREARNLAVAAAGAATVRLAETPVVLPLARLVQRRRWGLLQQARLPAWLEVPLGVALMDYTLYLWHVLVHKVPLLWRFHQPHHVDLDFPSLAPLRCRHPRIHGAIVPGTDQVSQGGDGLLGIGAVGHEFEHRAALGGEGRQVQEALGVGHGALGDDSDVRPERLCQDHQLGRRTQVEPEGIGDDDLATDFERSSGHRWLR